MPRLRNEVTGAVMSVSDSLAALLGSEWVPADQQQSEPDEAPKRRGGRPRQPGTNE
jgi:hypothetical protein